VLENRGKLPRKPTLTGCIVMRECADRNLNCAFDFITVQNAPVQFSCSHCLIPSRCGCSWASQAWPSLHHHAQDCWRKSESYIRPQICVLSCCQIFMLLQCLLVVLWLDLDGGSLPRVPSQDVYALEGSKIVEHVPIVHLMLRSSSQPD